MKSRDVQINKFRRCLAAETCLKMHYFGKNPKNRQALGASLPDPHLYSMTRKCARLHTQWAFL